MSRMIYLITFLIVYYNAPDYELDVYEYAPVEYEIEITCAEGFTDCKDSVEESKNRVQKTQSNHYAGSYYNHFPYIFQY